MNLSQKNLLKRQELILEHSKIHIVRNSIGNNDEFKIDFENVLPNKFNVRKTNIILFMISAFFYLISLFVFYGRFVENDKDVAKDAYIFWGIIATVILILAVITRENYWRIDLSNNTFIKIFKRSPSEKEVNTFIEELFTARDIYLNETYGKLNLNLDYEKQHNNLLWLKNMKSINENEFEEKINNLNDAFKINTTKIGF